MDDKQQTVKVSAVVTEGTAGGYDGEFLSDELVAAIVEKNADLLTAEPDEDEVYRATVNLYQQLKYQSLYSGGYNDFIQNSMLGGMEDIRERAIKEIKLERVLEEIITRQAFEISPAELDEEVKAVAKRQNMTIEMVENVFGDGLDLLIKDLLTKKAIAYACSQL